MSFGNPSFGGFDFASIGTPLTKETDTTYGGTKPGKAPTLKQPDAPDPYKLIEEQTKANRPDQAGPLRNTRFRKDENGNWVETTAYSPELQGLFNQRIGMMGEDVPLLDQPTDESFGTEGSKLERSTFDRAKNLMNPGFEQEQKAMTTQLSNQGIPMGSEAYNTELDNFSRRKREAVTNAALGAVGAGRQEQGRLFGQATSSREQGYRQNISRRQQLYNELASLMGTAQIGKPAELDVMGPFTQQYQGQINSVNAANANSAQRNAQTTGAVGSIATMLMSMFSDFRLKKDIEPIGRMSSGLPLYKFRYLWDKPHDPLHTGVMARETMELFPEAVGEMYGYLTVDYSRIH